MGYIIPLLFFYKRDFGIKYPYAIENKERNWYLCIYVTTKKPNFPKRFQTDNGKNRNIPEQNLSKQTIK